MNMRPKGEQREMEITNRIFAFPWLDLTANNCNTYLLHSEKRILVDPGHHHLFQGVEDHLTHLSLTVQDIDFVIITHAHPDHMESVRRFLETNALVAVHQLEMEFVREMTPHYVTANGGFEPHIMLQEGDLRIGDIGLQVIHTPGHSPGSICLYWPEEKALITGDLIFNQGIGRTDLPGGNGQALKESIKKTSALDVEILLPGHGDVIQGRDAVRKNFEDVESFWFAYI
jgi:hydroxyacylglutathione hydrolase